VYDKTMEMQVLPSHNELKNTMETGNTGVIPNQQSAPDHRTGPIKMESDLINFSLERWRSCRHQKSGIVSDDQHTVNNFVFQFCVRVPHGFLRSPKSPAYSISHLGIYRNIIRFFVTFPSLAYVFAPMGFIPHIRKTQLSHFKAIFVDNTKINIVSKPVKIKKRFCKGFYKS
jgi:hypothetical protein